MTTTTGESNQFEPNLDASIQTSRKLKDIVDINCHYSDAGKRIFLEIENFYAQLDAECFDCVVCAQILSILAKYCLEIVPERFDAIAGGVLEKYLSILTQSDFRGIASTIWALARSGCENEDAIKAFLDEAVKKVAEAKPQGIANILWASAILGFKDHPVVAISVNKAREMLVSGLFCEKGVVQLYHFNLDTELFPEIDNVFRELETAGKFKTNTSVSPWEREIVEEAKTIFADRPDFDVRTSFKTDGFECDIALIYDHGCRRVNIEIDGVVHRVGKLTNQFRDRILEKLGWHAVVRISYDDIRNRGTGSIADLVKQKLRLAGVPI